MSARERVGDRGQRQAEPREVWPREELSWGPVEADAALRHRDRAVGELRDERQVMRDQDDRRLSLSFVTKDGDELALVAEVLSERRLVEDEHIWARHQRAGNG